MRDDRETDRQSLKDIKEGQSERESDRQREKKKRKRGAKPRWG